MAIAIGTMRRREGSPNCGEKKRVSLHTCNAAQIREGIEALKEKNVGD
jgi:hypothetical protein